MVEQRQVYFGPIQIGTSFKYFPDGEFKRGPELAELIAESFLKQLTSTSVQ